MFNQFDLFSTTTISSGLGLFPLDTAIIAAEVEEQDHVIPASRPAAVLATDFRLSGDRALARGWRERARDNLAAIRLSGEIVAEGRAATTEEQAELVKFTGFGATDLAQNIFRRPGEATFRRPWRDLGEELERLTCRAEYASLARCTQYAHYTPEPIVRAIWAGLMRLGFAGGRILEPGVGTGLFPAMMPDELRSESHVTGIEIDPVTARIARLLHPGARILNEDFARAALPAHFDLVVGNPPFSDRVVRSDPAFRDLALRLHDFFIVRAIDRLKPGGLAAFVTSTGTMDKADGTARRHIASMADLVGAIRLPEAAMRSAAGTDVVVDVLFFRKRRELESCSGTDWLGLAELPGLSRGDAVAGEPGAVLVNSYFAQHAEAVLGTHALTSIRDEEGEKRILNVVETEAAKEKLSKIKEAFASWVWTDPDRTDRLARVYNDRFNNIVPRAFDGRHLNLPGTSGAFDLRAHQKRVVWRVVSAGSTYIAHAVGAGKTLSIAAAIMEQRRLGLVAKAMLVVPGHCLAQAAREFLALYPIARILVADESNFVKEKRHRFLARAATATWDAIIITHSAFKFIAAPAGFEHDMIRQELDTFEALATKLFRDDRVSRKRLERMKEGLAARLEALTSRKDDLLTIAEIGIDQIIVDEAQEFRKLSFQTNMTSLRGIDPNGSQRAWDLFVKTQFIATKNPGRALILASGTPITNTVGEMYTVQRFMDPTALEARSLSAFDAWAATFGDASTELELQPSGKYKPVTRFAQFVNVPELIAMFRATADVVQPDDLRQYVRVPAVTGGKRQIITAPATPVFKAYQAILDRRMKAIEARRGQPKKGDDILLSVIGDGRHAAIDLRLVIEGQDNEPANKLNLAIGNILRVWRETSALPYSRRDGTPFERPGAGQLVFCDLGTLAAEAKRGFSVYRWIRDELVRLGVPAADIAFMQDFRKSEAKARLFADFNAGRVRILIGSSETMGTGVNVQLRLKALHHLDVPWLPSQIEQREGRIIRQGNSHDEVEIYAYATLGSLDATMWQQNERKARFIAAALSGDTSVRRLEDLDGQANQFAMAKAIASGDERLMQKAGLEAEIARLNRLEAAHFDDQHAIRRQLRDAEATVGHAERRISEITRDLTRRTSTTGDAFGMILGGVLHEERKAAGQALMTEILTLVQLRHQGQSIVGSIGGFDVVFSGRVFGQDDFLFDTWLARTGFEQEITLDMTVTPLGAVARLERALDGFEGELTGQTARLADARRRIASYQTRVGVTFGMADELAEKRSRLAEIDADLAATSADLLEPEAVAQAA